MREGDVGAGTAVRTAACPGGMARQFRVQVQDDSLPLGWRLVGSFRDAESATTCARRATSVGHLTRIIECRALPTAA